MQHIQTSPIIAKSSLPLWLVVFTVVCSPLGINFIYGLQVAGLNESWYFAAATLRNIWFVLPLFWFGVVIFTPIATALSLIWRDSPFGHNNRLTLSLWLVSWGCVLAGPYAMGFRRSGLLRITERAQPLIAAIDKYGRDKGHYPPTLEALVPGYIAEIPYTGAVGYPSFKYIAAEHESGENHLFEKYQLYVDTPFGLNFDCFVYWPEHRYPERMYGGSSQRIGDWAYIND